ncbi:MAG: nucleoside triphosphate pyrophosphohydrolase [Lentisphaerae bacterium]|nr:nucleoside triphosphate pyrophosphohydrolase [Lentisphaerota bacterium]
MSRDTPPPPEGSATPPTPSPGPVIDHLRAILARLRGPGGCPWDREQTLETLKPCLIEECYELLDVMDTAACDAHAEELGDVLLQVLFQAQLREERGDFTLDEVARRLAAKLIRRHPHVFGETQVNGTADVLRNWEAIKKGERTGNAEPAAPRSALAGVPAALPALLRAQRVQAKASRVGFDWPDSAGPRQKIAEELAELEAAVAAQDQRAVADEMGDLLFSVVNLCRFLKVDAETALRDCTARFSARFQAIERRIQAEGRDLRACTPEELDRHWEAVKRQ